MGDHEQQKENIQPIGTQLVLSKFELWNAGHSRILRRGRTRKRKRKRRLPSGLQGLTHQRPRSLCVKLLSLAREGILLNYCWQRELYPA